MIVLAFPDEADAAGRLARALDAPFAVIAVHEFPDGETLPTVPPLSGTTVIYRSLDRPNGKLALLLLAADAARRAGASRLVLVCPYLAYLRQDAVFAPGQPVSRDVICALLGRAFDRVVTVDAHLHRTPDLSAAMGVRADDLSAAGPLAAALDGERPVVVGPDRESAPWAGAIAARLGGEAVVFSKSRQGDRAVRLEPAGLEAVKGRRVIVADDVASSGATLLAVLEQLRRAGAGRIEIAVVHALFGPDIETRLRAAGAKKIVSTDSVAHSTNAAPLADLIAGALRDEPR